MSDLWPRVSKKNPCAVCGGEDWCTQGDFSIRCMRVESSTPARGGGYYHKINGATMTRQVKAMAHTVQEYIPTSRLKELLNRWGRLTPPGETKRRSEALALSEIAFRAVGAVYNASKSAWAFPMHDGEGRIVGISLRGADGFKWTMQGTRNGLFHEEGLSTMNRERGAPIYVVEGATDTVSLVGLGMLVVGRHSCKGGADQISVLLERLGVYRAVIVADNDEMKKLGPREGRPGIEGAVELQKALHMRSVIYIPPSPFKDVREFVKNGGTKAMIESDIKNKVWTKP